MCPSSIIGLGQIAVASGCLGIALAVGFNPLRKRLQRELSTLATRARDNRPTQLATT